MRRREFAVLLGGAALAWPIGAHSQPTGRMPTVGCLGGIQVESSPWVAAFTQRLRELGWSDGRNIAIEYRWTQGLVERATEAVAEFVRLKVDVIHVTGNPSALIAKRATSTIPIVFALAGDPVGTGLVDSLARPGGNVTGLSTQLTDAAGKRVELLRDAIPGLRRFAMMVNPSSPLSALETDEVRAAAGRLGIEVITLEIRHTRDIAPAFETLKDRASALYVANDGLLAANRMRINTMALGAQMPTMYGERTWLDMGGLMSYGANFVDLYRRSADYVDKILRGTRPADIPVEQPTKFSLGVNRIAAKAIGLAIPEAFFVRADEIIE